MSAQVLSSEAPAPEIDDAAEGTLMAHMACLLDDAPKLQVALKNLMAVLLGSDASRRSADDAVDGKVTDIKAFDLLVCSKTLVKVLSDVSLAEAPQWGAENPQGDNQSFSDRITEISQYKAALVFFKRAKASGAGISKSVGRKFIQQTKCMTQLRTGVKISLCSKIEEDIIDLFLDTFESSIAGIGPNVDLIWCNDFATALALRQHVRKQDILSRDVSSIAVSGMATVEELPEDDSKNAADKTDENKPILL